MLSIARYALVSLFLYFLYFHGLDGAGLLGPDEPRYAWIGREMALSGDWVTPRLFGEAWFEKPVLLYWMTGAGFRLGLGPDLAPRLPLAIVSVAFLFGYWRLLREEIGEQAAALSAVLLAGSAGWLAFSHVAVTDAPLTAAFSLGMLAACRWLRTGETGRLWFTGVCLGLAVLAKGMVPLVLAAPLLWMGRRRWRDLWRVAAAGAAVAGPWYLLCYVRNGTPFFEEFIWKHHIARFFTRSLEHVQPFWFYLPVMLGGLFPWTPLVGLLRGPGADSVLRFLWAWLVFGFVFFSASLNKLPGYILPLMPPLCALLGVALARRRRAPVWLAACALMMALLPVIAAALPRALEAGIRKSAIHPPPAWIWLAVAAGVGAVALAERAGRRDWSMTVLLAGLCSGVWLVQSSAYPKLDEIVSARALWRRTAVPASQICLDDPHRARRYGLNYYSQSVLPDCETNPRPNRLR